MKKHLTIILASASPRRSQLMQQAGFTFHVIPSQAEETTSLDEPELIVEELAYKKANDVYQQIKSDYHTQDFIVIGADTIVCYNGEILGKPMDEKEAFDMLTLLSDRTHQVYTGITIIHKVDGVKHIYTFHERTDVTFYPIHDVELKEYIKSMDGMDKAGGYGIQGPFAKYIKGIDGDYNNVVGLPIGTLYQKMKQFHIL